MQVGQERREVVAEHARWRQRRAHWPIPNSSVRRRSGGSRRVLAPDSLSRPPVIRSERSSSRSRCKISTFVPTAVGTELLDHGYFTTKRPSTTALADQYSGFDCANLGLIVIGASSKVGCDRLECRPQRRFACVRQPADCPHRLSLVVLFPEVTRYRGSSVPGSFRRKTGHYCLPPSGRQAILSAVTTEQAGALRLDTESAERRRVWRDATAMTLYVSIVLLAELAALPAGDEAGGTVHGPVGWELIAIIWGTTVGLALAHWFAFPLWPRKASVGGSSAVGTAPKRWPSWAGRPSSP